MSFAVNTTRAPRLAMLGVAMISLIVVELPHFLTFHPDTRGWALMPTVLHYGVMVGLPFFLRAMFPAVADFDTQLLPSARSEWLSFLGMVVLLVGMQVLGAWLWQLGRDSFELPWSEFYAPEPRHVVVTWALIAILFGPIAEEIFWRAYFLDQLRKFMRSGFALFFQSVLFALAHYRAIQLMPFAFLFGIIAGGWRIRFKSLVPLALAHIIVNSIAWGPWYVVQYERSLRLWPRYHEVDLIANKPGEEAVPKLIAVMGDHEDMVALHAVDVLLKNYANDAAPYLKKALGSNDNRKIDRALFAIELSGKNFLDLIPQVRAVAWSSGDRKIQTLAILTLKELGDEEGLSDIAQKHPEDRMRESAAAMLKRLKEGNDTP
jgi:membrane protease YdiL (CAAX protease family)